MFEYSLTGLVTLLTLLVYLWIAMNVGSARAKHEIKAPEMTGPEEFNRYMRVHGNTMEMMLLFLPALWLFALTVSDIYAAAIGVFFPLSRIFYARGYYRAADQRGRGFLVGFITTAALLLGSLAGLLYAVYVIYC